jgi:hypothetical protein
VAAHPEGKGDQRRLTALSQHEAVVDELVKAAQIERPVVLIRDGKAEHVDPEPARAGEVGHDQLGICRAHDVGGFHSSR